MATRVKVAQLHVDDRDRLQAWIRDFGADTRSVWCDEQGQMWAEIFRTRDGDRYVDEETGQAARMEVELPDRFAKTFPIKLMPNTGIEP